MTPSSHSYRATIGKVKKPPFFNPDWILSQFGDDKSEAIKVLIGYYIENEGEPELRPEFIERIKKAEKGKFVKVKDFSKHYGA